MRMSIQIKNTSSNPTQRPAFMRFSTTLMASKSTDRKTTCAFISKILYSKMVSKSGGKMQEKIMRSKFDILRNGILNRIDLFKHLSTKEKTQILEVMRPITYKKGDFICRYGDKAYEFHIIIKGEVDILLNDDQELSGYN